MADAAEDRTWLFDSVLGFLRGPGWCLPVMGFIDENCVVFDTEEEPDTPPDPPESRGRPSLKVVK